MHSLGTESQKGFVQDILVFPAVLDTSSFPEDQLRAGIRKKRSWLEQISLPQASNLVGSVVWSLVLPANPEHLGVTAALHLEF